jgi:hypothetical protein
MAHPIYFVRFSMEEPLLFVWRNNPKERPEARKEVSVHELAEFRKQQRQAVWNAKVGPSSLCSYVILYFDLFFQKCLCVSASYQFLIS